jgi:hypothetical protein
MCGRVQRRPRGPISFSVTLGPLRCFNFADKPPSPPDPRTRGHITIWQGDRCLSHTGNNMSEKTM